MKLAVLEDEEGNKPVADSLYERAFILFQEVAKINSDGDLQFILGKLAERIEKKDLAEEYYRYAAAKGIAAAHRELAAIYQMRGEEKEAQREFLLAATENDVKSCLMLADQLISSKQYSKAEQWLKKALNGKPDFEELEKISESLRLIKDTLLSK